jgi:hypothetical protein
MNILRTVKNVLAHVWLPIVIYFRWPNMHLSASVTFQKKAIPTTYQRMRRLNKVWNKTNEKLLIPSERREGMVIIATQIYREWIVNLKKSENLKKDMDKAYRETKIVPFHMLTEKAELLQQINQLEDALVCLEELAEELTPNSPNYETQEEEEEEEEEDFDSEETLAQFEKEDKEYKDDTEDDIQDNTEDDYDFKEN